MPLQLRRGNTAEVNSITPLVGEIVYDTQLKRIVVGDGSTTGGTPIAGVTINEAKDAAAESLLAGSHQNISFTYNSSTKALSATVDIVSFETIEADVINTTKITDGSTIVLDVENALLNGDVKGSVFSNNSTLLVDAATNSFFGNLTGNVIGDVTGNIVTNLISSSDSSSIIVDTPTIFQTSVNFEGDSVFSSEVRFVTNESALRTISLDQFHNTNAISFLELRRSRGSSSSPINVQDGDLISLILSQGKTTNGYDTVAGIFTRIQGTPTPDYAPAGFDFWTRSASTNTYQTRFRIDNDGGLLQSIEFFNTDSLYRINQYHNDADSRDFRWIKARGTVDNLTAVLPDDITGKFTFQGYDGSNYATSAQIRGVVDSGAVIGPGAISGRVDFLIADNTGTLRTRLQIGPLQTLHSGQFIIENNAINGLPLYVLNNTSSVHDGSRFGLRRSRGSYSSPSAVVNGDALFRIGFGGYDGSAYRDSAFITATVAGTVSSGVIPTKLTVLTENTSGVKTVALEITETQVVNFSNAIRLATYADATARDTAIPSPVAGMMVYISGTGKFQGYNSSTSSWDDLN